MKMKKEIVRRLLIIICSVIVLLVLLIPMPSYADDGGTEKYEAILYSVTIRHSMWENQEGFDWYRPDLEEGVRGYLTGTNIKIFGITVRDDNVKFQTTNECKCKRCSRKNEGRDHEGTRYKNNNLQNRRRKNFR